MTASELPHIATQYADEAGFLVRQRIRAVGAPNVTLADLGQIDQRLAGHLAGLRLSPEFGGAACDAAIVEEDWGGVFASLVLALEFRDRARVDHLLDLAEATPSLRPGVTTALAWVSRHYLQGTVKDLLAASSSFRRLVAVECCAAHGVDPGQALNAAAVDDDPMLRSQALAAAGDLGRVNLWPLCEQSLGDPDCRAAAARSAVLLGSRDLALDTLTEIALTPGPNRVRAFGLALAAIGLSSAHHLLQQIGRDPEQRRWLIQGSGIAGDPAYIPWLIRQTDDLGTARIAGEAFSLITGLALSRTGLQRPQPDGFESGPDDDPEHADVAMDQDDGLPWPDRGKIEAWWAANNRRFVTGRRYFMGAEVSVESCVGALKNGYQRQRIAAAEQLVLLEPGSVIFNTAAPARRQWHLLGRTDAAFLATQRGSLAGVPE